MWVKLCVIAAALASWHTCSGKPVARRMTNAELNEQRRLSWSLNDEGKVSRPSLDEQLAALSSEAEDARSNSPYTIDDPDLAAQQLGPQYARPNFAFHHNDDDALGPAYEKPPPLPPPRKKQSAFKGVWRKLSGGN